MCAEKLAKEVRPTIATFLVGLVTRRKWIGSRIRRRFADGAARDTDRRDRRSASIALGAFSLVHVLLGSHLRRFARPRKVKTSQCQPAGTARANRIGGGSSPGRAWPSVSFASPARVYVIFKNQANPNARWLGLAESSRTRAPALTPQSVGGLFQTCQQNLLAGYAEPGQLSFRRCVLMRVRTNRYAIPFAPRRLNV